MRELKFHEKKLLKKTNFVNWKTDNNIHEVKVIRRYHLQDREDYTRYSQLFTKIHHTFLDIIRFVELSQNLLISSKN